MTQEQFDNFPLLLRRKEVVDCGFENKTIDEIAYVLKTPKDKVPWGKIGAVPYGKTQRQHRYRKLDVAKMIGLKA